MRDTGKMVRPEAERCEKGLLTHEWEFGPLLKRKGTLLLKDSKQGIP